MKVTKTRRYKVGYEIRYEQITPDDPEWWGEAVVIPSAYTLEGNYYIGSSKWAHRLFVKHGLRQVQPVFPGEEGNGGRGTTCAIGFNPAEQRWYGWSHRAMCSFGIGSKVESEDHLCAQTGWTDEWLSEHPEDGALICGVGFEAKTLDDAKRMARAFADAVA